MRRILLWKGLTVLGLALLLLIPLSMIQGQIEARNQRQAEVKANVAASAAGRQQLVGPLLVVAYTEQVTHETTNEKTGQTLRKTTEVQGHQVLAPKDLQIQGEAHVEERHRGLYKAQLYHLNAKLTGRFAIPSDFGLDLSRRSITLGRSYLVVGIPDLRGLRKQPRLTWDGKAFDVGTTAKWSNVPHGIQADLGKLDIRETRSFDFELPLELTGSQSLSIAPVGENTQMSLRSDWPSPSFGGRFLPLDHQIGDQGFVAHWQVSALARNLDRILRTEGNASTEEAFEVAFIEPVNVYLQTERAVKYGFLFVGMTFAGFFFFELLRRLRIHPMQYLLVGFALAMFFLLLLSLTEHIPFLWAYLAASGASIVLLGTYLVHVLRSAKHGLGFAAGLTLLFGVLYGLLMSEDNALLMGSVLLFAALATVMLATRRLDWYGLSEKPPELDPTKPQN
ncbi:MAG: cell envelope integrity protein CreD [Holophaga sp.]|nr:cell envelope integrity protein CreD [Holophaga sp.]